MSVIPKVRKRSMARLAYLAAAAVLLGVPGLAAADEVFSQTHSVTIPGVPLASFDISWVNPDLNTYFLADRSNKSIDVIDTTNTNNVSQLIPTGPDAFAGPVPASGCPDNAANDCAGPDGVLTVSENGDHHGQWGDGEGGDTHVWAGDGPTAQSQATTGATCAAHPPGSTAALNGKCSTVKIFALGNSDPVRIVPTNGQERADELCYDPKDHLVQIANDADSPPFITFISTEGNNKVLGQLTIPESNGGIEQCQWNPRNGMIYLNIPSTISNPNGEVYVIDPRHETIVARYDATDGCQPAGMAIGPDHQILLGCGGPDAIVMSDDGAILATLTGQGGNDEVWYNPGDGHYFLAESKNPSGPQLGIVDSESLSADGAVKPTGSSSHSVAADPDSKQVFLPVNSGSSTLCDNFGGSAAQGCVAVFSPNGRDDVAYVYRDHDHH